MSDRPSHNLDGLDIDMARRVDEVCRRFEADWREGRQPRIEDYLVDVSHEGRHALEAELEALERELRLCEETVARPQAGPVTAPEPRTAPDQSAIAESPAIVPGTVPTPPLPGPALSSVHEADTVPPQDDATADLGQPGSSRSAAAQATCVRYFGDYEITRELARGGMGVVFQARQISLKRVVALKMILAGQLADETEVRRFHIEAEAAANLDHPGIVPIYEVGQHEGQHYFSMGFVEGQSLAQRLAAGPLPPREAAALMVKVSEAIEYAHQRGVIHRDLKPANILLDAQGNPRVTDFGLAKKVHGDSGLTGSGQIMGTPSYMPPEQAGGQRGDVGPASDVYALGATLYALISGRPPFQAATPMDTVLQVVSDEPVPPRRLNAAVPRDLETICLKCLQKNPARRYASAAALADDLGRWLRHEPIRARRSNALERLTRWARRRPAVAGLSLLVLAALATVIALGLRDRRRSRETIKLVTEQREQAFQARNEARTSETEAIEARNEARREANQNLRRLVRSAVGNGNRFVEDGNPLLALPWYVSALKNEPDGPQAEQVHRVRLASVLGAAPRLTRIEVKSVYLPGGARASGSSPADSIQPPKGQEVTRRITSPDRKHTLVTTAPRHDSVFALPDRRHGTASVWDAATGKTVFPALSLPYRVVDGLFVGQGRQFLTVMEIELPPRRDIAGNQEVHSELRIWSSDKGEPVGEPIPIPLADVRVERNAAGDRLLVRGDHVRARIGAHPHGRTEFQVRDTESPKTRILPRGDELFQEARFSPDGRLVAAAAGPVARFYGANDGEPLPASLNHDQPIERIAFAPDGHSVITMGADIVRLWDVPSGRPLAPAVQGQSFLAFSSDSRLMLMKSSLGVPQVWWLDRFHNRVTLASPPLPAAAWSPTIRPERDPWSAFQREPAQREPTQLEAEFANEGYEVVITSRNRLENSTETRAWAIRSPEPTISSIYNQSTNAVRLASDGRSEISLSIRPGQCTPPWPGPLVRSASYPPTVLAPDGKTFARYITQANPAAGMPIPGPNGKLRPALPDANFAAIPAFVLFSTEDGTLLGAGPVMPAEVVRVGYSGDARRILLVSSSAPVENRVSAGGPYVDSDLDFQILDVPSLRPAGPVIRLAKPLGPFALSHDGGRLAIIRASETAPVTLKVLDLKASKVKEVAQLDAVRVYDLQTGRSAPAAFRLRETAHPTLSLVDQLLFSPDGLRLMVRLPRPAAYTAGKYALPPVYLLNAESLQPEGDPLKITRTSGENPLTTESLNSFQSLGHDAALDRLAAFSPDGRLIAFADGGNLVGVFETATGKRPGGALPSHSGRVLWVSFSPDGQRLVTTGSEGMARLWDATTGAPIGPPMLHPGVVQAEFNPEGTLLITSGWSGLVRVWDGRSADLLINGFDFQRAIEGLVLGPGPRRVVFCLRMQTGVITCDVPVEDRPLEQLESLSIVLSGHLIDSGEGLSPALPERVEAARATLVRRDPAHFAVSVSQPPVTPPAGQRRP